MRASTTASCNHAQCDDLVEDGLYELDNNAGRLHLFWERLRSLQARIFVRGVA